MITVKSPPQATRVKTMGEVRVPVKLTNARDAELAADGDLPLDRVRTCVATAVVDTGAVCSVVPQHILDKLGVRTRGRRVAQMADGRTEIVEISRPLLIEIEGRETVDEALVLGDEVLIGQTVLEKTDLLVDCTNQRVVGNPDHPDQPVLKIR